MTGKKTRRNGNKKTGDGFPYGIDIHKGPYLTSKDMKDVIKIRTWLSKNVPLPDYKWDLTFVCFKNLSDYVKFKLVFGL